MTRPASSPPEPTDRPQDPTFEQALAELEVIVHQLEQGDLGLEQSLARYEQGVKHLKHCYHLLKATEQRIELLTGVGENGQAITEPFREESLPREDQTGSRRRKRSAAADLSDEEP